MLIIGDPIKLLNIKNITFNTRTVKITASTGNPNFVI